MSPKLCTQVLRAQRLWAEQLIGVLCPRSVTCLIPLQGSIARIVFHSKETGSFNDIQLSRIQLPDLSPYYLTTTSIIIQAGGQPISISSQYMPRAKQRRLNKFSYLQSCQLISLTGRIISQQNHFFKSCYDYGL